MTLNSCLTALIDSLDLEDLDMYSGDSARATATETIAAIYRREPRLTESAWDLAQASATPESRKRLFEIYGAVLDEIADDARLDRNMPASDVVVFRSVVEYLMSEIATSSAQFERRCEAAEMLAEHVVRAVST